MSRFGSAWDVSFYLRAMRSERPKWIDAEVQHGWSRSAMTAQTSCADPTSTANPGTGSFRCDYRSRQQLIELGLVELDLIKQPVEISNLVEQISLRLSRKKQMR